MTRVADIDWSAWTPTEKASLCFIVRDGQVLLIHKKRGLGAGYLNGPGGRMEPGETEAECALRETQEELGVTPLGLEKVGELRFEFLSGYKLQTAVFRASDCRGEPRETPEAIPAWTPLDDIPYARMWEDDPFWLPHLLAGRPFRGCFTFDGQRLLSHRVTCPDTRAVLSESAG